MDLVKPVHAWIMSKLIDVQPKPVSLNDIILNLCESALSDIKTSSDFSMILIELEKGGYIKKPGRNRHIDMFQTEPEDSYMITSKGVLEFRLQIIKPIIRICDENLEVKEHLIKIKKMLSDNINNIGKYIITLCLNNAVSIVELVKELSRIMGQ